uniref:UspA domain-containing protein n=1 Tax=Salix viminalis TaxID=40686 RepID=A0A6N2MZC8_SALVM
MENTVPTCEQSDATSRSRLQNFNKNSDWEWRAQDVICNTVEKLRPDTLVMEPWLWALLGSVSENCAKRVKCPVVIVKHPRDE